MTMTRKILAGCYLFALASCQKQNISDFGNILATVKHDGNIVYPAVLYIRYGTSPAGPSDYDYMQVGDPYGQAYFRNLAAGTYSLSASGIDGRTHSIVSGMAVLCIGSQVRTNIKSITVELK